MISLSHMLPLCELIVMKMELLALLRSFDFSEKMVWRRLLKLTATLS